MFQYFNTSTNALLYYGSLWIISATLLVLGIIRFSRKERGQLGDTLRWCILPVTFSVCGAIAIPLFFRMRLDMTPALLWECDSIHDFFSAFTNKKSVWDFTVQAALTKPGVLSESAQTLFFGAPTFAIMKLLGWNTFTLHSVSLLAGVLSVAMGAYLIKMAFNSGTAACFAIIFATNPLLVHYMGYAVAVTGTLFALLLAGVFIFRTLSGRGIRSLNAVLAITFLFGSSFNYGPGRIFLVTTLIFLGSTALFGGIVGAIPGRVRLWALAICIGTTGALIVEKKLNPGSNFSTMRAEHAFFQHRWKGNLVEYLGDTPEVQSLDPNNLSKSVRVRFIFAVAQKRFQQFYETYSPTYQLLFTNRGAYFGDHFRPYQSGLIVFIIIGLLLSLRRAFTLGNWYIITFFFIGLIPLLLVNRLDLHRSFLLVFPISAWAAQGLWAVLERLYRCGVPRVAISVVTIAFSISLVGSNYYVNGVQESTQPDLIEATKAVLNDPEPASVLGSSHLICQQRSWVELNLADLSRKHPETQISFFPAGFLDNISDNYFNTNSVYLQEFLTLANLNKVSFITAVPYSKLHKMLLDKGLIVSINQTKIGYAAWTIEKSRL